MDFNSRLVGTGGGVQLLLILFYPHMGLSDNGAFGLEISLFDEKDDDKA
jgi:hypothetical protein